MAFLRPACCVRVLLGRRTHFSSLSKGQDLLGDIESSSGNNKPKMILESHAPSGFDVSNMIERVHEEEEAASGALHMTGSIMVFPHGCFFWNVQSVSNVSVEALMPALLHRPKLQYLFIGSNQPMPRNKLIQLKSELRERAGIVLEQLDLSNAMGTFNVLNSEDRPVGAALILEKKSPDDTDN